MFFVALFPRVSILQVADMSFFYDPHARREEDAIRECVEEGEIDYLDVLNYLFAVAEGRELSAEERGVREKIRAYCAKYAPPTIN